MSNDTLLEIQDTFTIRGRGLCLIPKTFLSVVPSGQIQSFTERVLVVRPNGTSETYEARFEIWHFSLASDTDGISGRFSFVVLLPGKSELDVPSGSQLRISKTQLDRIQAMIKPK